MGCDPPCVTYVGHATLLLELDGLRVLTDPVLRDRVAHLYRYASSPGVDVSRAVDAILISHLHRDHLDLPSLRRLGRDIPLIVPAGAGSFLKRRGFSAVQELKPGESISLDSLSITATPAAHSGFRPPSGPTGVPLGFTVSGSYHLYFAGDTDIFPAMADLAGTIDIALIPVWGWGRTLGPGHLDPQRAADALTLLRPSRAIPIHWGTFAPPGAQRRDPSFLQDPPRLFADYAGRVAPEVTITILQPGECTPMARSRAEATE